MRLLRFAERLSLGPPPAHLTASGFDAEAHGIVLDLRMRRVQAQLHTDGGDPTLGTPAGSSEIAAVSLEPCDGSAGPRPQMRRSEAGGDGLNVHVRKKLDAKNLQLSIGQLVVLDKTDTPRLFRELVAPCTAPDKAATAPADQPPAQQPLSPSEAFESSGGEGGNKRRCMLQLRQESVLSAPPPYFYESSDATSQAPNVKSALHVRVSDCAVVVLQVQRSSDTHLTAT